MKELVDDIIECLSSVNGMVICKGGLLRILMEDTHSEYRFYRSGVTKDIPNFEEYCKKSELYDFILNKLPFETELQFSSRKLDVESSSLFNNLFVNKSTLKKLLLYNDAFRIYHGHPVIHEVVDCGRVSYTYDPKERDRSGGYEVMVCHHGVEDDVIYYG